MEAYSLVLLLIINLIASIFFFSRRWFGPGALFLLAAVCYSLALLFK